jgi:hypothetical protein
VPEEGPRHASAARPHRGRARSRGRGGRPRGARSRLAISSRARLALGSWRPAGATGRGGLARRAGRASCSGSCSRCSRCPGSLAPCPAPSRAGSSSAAAAMRPRGHRPVRRSAAPGWTPPPTPARAARRCAPVTGTSVAPWRPTRAGGTRPPRTARGRGSGSPSCRRRGRRGLCLRPPLRRLASTSYAPSSSSPERVLVGGARPGEQDPGERSARARRSRSSGREAALGRGETT